MEQTAMSSVIFMHVPDGVDKICNAALTFLPVHPFTLELCLPFIWVL